MSSVAVCYAASYESFTDASGGGGVSVDSSDSASGFTSVSSSYPIVDIYVSISGEYIDADSEYHYYGDSASIYVPEEVGLEVYDYSVDTSCSAYGDDYWFIIDVSGEHSYTAGPYSETVYTYAD